MELLFSELRAEMERAQAIQSEQANKSWMVGTPLKIGDKVLLDTRNISTTRPSKKPDWKRIEMYKITGVISTWANWNKLIDQLYIHDVQPISYHEKAVQDPLPYQ
jgi:hypothetical protein